MKKNIRKLITGLVIPSLVVLVLGSCATSAPKGHTYAGGDDEYTSLGLSRTAVEPWEDGMRTTGEKGTYEWWYFDSRLEDGSTLVIVFYTKIMLEINKGLDPVVSVKLTSPDGSVAFNRFYRGKAAEFSADTETCDVRIGPNRFSGDLETYRVEFDFDDLRGDITLTGTAPAWRPGTGHSFFADGKGVTYFAWLPAVPRGVVEGTLTLGGKTVSVTGSGYHDHNWGDASIVRQMHDWYWGRAEVGPYTVISAFITATDYYGGGQGSTFVLFRDDEVLAEDGRYVTCTLDDVYVDAKTGKPVANTICYDYDDGKNRYRVTYRRERDIESARFADEAGGFKRFIAGIIGFDGAYLRFTGQVTIEILEGNRIVKSVSQDAAVWELMYLGHAPAASGK